MIGLPILILVALFKIVLPLLLKRGVKSRDRLGRERKTFAAGSSAPESAGTASATSGAATEIVREVEDSSQRLKTLAGRISSCWPEKSFAGKATKWKSPPGSARTAARI